MLNQTVSPAYVVSSVGWAWTAVALLRARLVPTAFIPAVAV